MSKVNISAKDIVNAGIYPVLLIPGEEGYTITIGTDGTIIKTKVNADYSANGSVSVVYDNI